MTATAQPGTPLPVVASLSPSRAGDFMQCPLMFRFRTIDRLPQAPSPAATRGTVVHSVLERLFDLPAAERTLAAAEGLLGPAWDELCAEEPEVLGMFAEPDELTTWLAGARDLLDAYFAMEDPTRLEPARREEKVQVDLPGGLRLRGIVDRVDVSPQGLVRVVDYKGLALDTPLPTPTGWTTMGEVEVGDELLGADGRPCHVIGKSSVHDRACYEVRFANGQTIVCDDVHLWSVHVPRGSGFEQRVVGTRELAELVTHRPTTVRGRRRLFIESTQALRLPDAELPIDPWVLGAWLGDGHSKHGGLTVGHEDAADMLSLIKERWAGRVTVQPASLEASGLSVSLLRPRQDLCPYGHDSWRQVDRAGRSHRRCTQERTHSPATRWNAALSELLSREGLRGNKHIPPAYLRASREQRLALLRGLMDTDGSWNGLRHRAVFVTTTPDLARGVRELVASLGGTSTFFTKPYRAQRGDRLVHVVEFRPCDFNPFSLPRKAMLVDEWHGRQRECAEGHPRRELRHTITSVTPVDRVPTQCVMVDSWDSLYLVGPTMVPTHNTGRAPSELLEGKALFQMKFYALVLWRTTGTIPTLLQLMYLGDQQFLRYQPEESDLLATERKLLALWEAIERATQLEDFRPSPSRLCSWCDHQALCPSFGGTPPPFPSQLVPLEVDVLPVEDVSA